LAVEQQTAVTAVFQVMVVIQYLDLLLVLVAEVAAFGIKVLQIVAAVDQAVEQDLAALTDQDLE
jgi:hypothetical protein